jgi:hypothetical protein
MESRYHWNAGPDELLGTADDFENGASTWHYDGADRLAGTCTVDTGADQLAFSADDNVTGCTVYRYGQGIVSLVSAVAPGQDGVWRTDDDVLGGSWSFSTLGAAGETLRTEVHALDAGATNPSESTLQAYLDFEYDVAGFAVAVLHHGGRGTDGQWNTSDDAPVQFIKSIHASDGLLVAQEYYAAGPDGRLRTADDELFRRYTY